MHSKKLQKDFFKAIELAQQDNENNPKNRRNTFNLALYYLVSGNQIDAERLYKLAGNTEISKYSINDAIQDLTDFLTLFPEHEPALQQRALLQKYLQSRKKSEAN